MTVTTEMQLFSPEIVRELHRPTSHQDMYEAVAQWLEKNTVDGAGLDCLVIHRPDDSKLLLIEGIVALHPQDPSNHMIAGYTGQSLVQQMYALMVSTPSRKWIMTLVNEEREAQLKKWGVQRHNRFIWSAILSEENGEVAQAALAGPLDAEECEDVDALRTELIQTAAVAVAWLEHLEEEA